MEVKWMTVLKWKNGFEILQPLAISDASLANFSRFSTDKVSFKSSVLFTSVSDLTLIKLKKSEYPELFSWHCNPRIHALSKSEILSRDFNPKKVRPFQHLAGRGRHNGPDCIFLFTNPILQLISHNVTNPFLGCPYMSILVPRTLEFHILSKKGQNTAKECNSPSCS